MKKEFTILIIVLILLPLYQYPASSVPTPATMQDEVKCWSERPSYIFGQNITIIIATTYKLNSANLVIIRPGIRHNYHFGTINPGVYSITLEFQEKHPPGKREVYLYDEDTLLYANHYYVFGGGQQPGWLQYFRWGGFTKTTNTILTTNTYSNIPLDSLIERSNPIVTNIELVMIIIGVMIVLIYVCYRRGKT